MEDKFVCVEIVDGTASIIILKLISEIVIVQEFQTYLALQIK